jgi:hypothetical protein
MEEIGDLKVVIADKTKREEILLAKVRTPLSPLFTSLFSHHMC